MDAQPPEWHAFSLVKSVRSAKHHVQCLFY